MIDLILLAVIALSALIGLMRGLLATVLGVVSWVVSGWAAFHFGEQVARVLSGGSQPTAGEYAGGYVLAFVGALLALMLLGMALRGLVDSTILLKWPDRLLGFGLGVVRGVLLAVLVVLVLGFTSMPGKPEWQQSVLLPPLQPMAGWLRGKLPQPPDLTELPHDVLMDLGKSVLAGDNARPNETDAGSGQPPAGQPGAGGSADPAGALPSNIDPAQVRPGHPDSTRDGAQGQARPPSR